MKRFSTKHLLAQGAMQSHDVEVQKVQNAPRAANASGILTHAVGDCTPMASLEHS